jgi:methionine-rich copper-binding protein CopC
MNGLVTANSKEKSPSPVPLQTKSPIITSFTNVKVSSEKINEVRTQEIAQKSTVENTEVTSMDITPPVRLG